MEGHGYCGAKWMALRICPSPFDRFGIERCDTAVKLSKWERRLIEAIDRHKVVLFFIIVSVLGMLIRLPARAFVSRDAKNCLLPWFNTIQEGGLKSLSKQVGDYNMVYQLLIALMTYLPIKPLYLYKGLSIVFDFLLAGVTALLVCELRQKKSRSCFAIVYAAVLFVPPVIFNSSIWAQCDSIYTTFVVASLYFLLKRKYKSAFALLGVALTFKLQAIFVVPFFIYYYFSEREFSLSNFLLTLLFFYIPCIPVILAGRGLLDPFRIYLHQAHEYGKMTLNFPSIWNLVGLDYGMLRYVAILLTFTVLGCGLFMLLLRKKSLREPDSFIKVAVWTVWTCLLLLPAMHERYGYMLDILLLVLTFVDRKNLLYLSVTLTCSMLTYGAFLFELPKNIPLLAVFFLAAYLLYTYTLLGGTKEKAESHPAGISRV